MNPKYAHVYQTTWWRLESGWIGFGERPFDDREIGLLWEIGQFEHKTVHLPGNLYRYEPNVDGVLTAYASKGLDGERWQNGIYRHEAKTVEELRAWIAKKANNMARGYARSADYHARCREAEAARYARARPATNVGGQ